MMKNGILKNVKECRIIRKKKLNEEFHKQDLIFDEYNLLFVNYSKKELSEKQMMNSALENIRIVETKNIMNKVKKVNEKIIQDRMTCEKNKINIITIAKGKNHYINTMKNNENIINLILMMICSIGRLRDIEGLELIINDSYNNEFIFYLVNYYDINENIFDVNFHILDFINHKINKLNQLNVEINALDQLAFNKILNLIYNNHDLTILNFSFLVLILHTLEGPC